MEYASFNLYNILNPDIPGCDFNLCLFRANLPVVVQPAPKDIPLAYNIILHYKYYL